MFADFDEVLEGGRLALRKQRLDYFNSVAPVSLIIETSPGKYHVYWFTLGMGLERFSHSRRSLLPCWAATRPSTTAEDHACPGFVHRKSGFLSRIAYTAESKGRRRKADFVLPDVLEDALRKTAKKFGSWDAPATPPPRQRKAPPKPAPDLFDTAPGPDERRYALAALVNAVDNIKTGKDHLSEGQRQLIRRAAMLSAVSERMEALAARGEAEFNVELYGTMCDRLGRLFGRLGLERVARR